MVRVRDRREMDLVEVRVESGRRQTRSRMDSSGYYLPGDERKLRYVNCFATPQNLAKLVCVFQYFGLAACALQRPNPSAGRFQTG